MGVDHIRIAITWFPYTIAPLALGVLLGRAPNQMFESTFEAQPRPRDKFTYYLMASTFWMAKLTLLFLIAKTIDVLFEEDFASSAMVLTGIAFLCFTTKKNLAAFIERQGVMSLNLAMAVVILSCISALQGANTARKLKAEETPTHELISGTLSDETPIVLLRNLDKGILFRNLKAGTIVFTPWDDIKQVSVKEREEKALSGIDTILGGLENARNFVVETLGKIYRLIADAARNCWDTLIQAFEQLRVLLSSISPSS